MSIEVSLVQLLVICSIINGIVFSSLLLEKRENSKASRFLALTILCMCLTFTPYMLDPAIWHRYRWLAWMPFSLSYWIGPSFYFYVRSLTRSNLTWRSADLWHFSPIVLNYLHSGYHLTIRAGDPYPLLHSFFESLEAMLR